jgi:hypothetical protein
MSSMVPSTHLLLSLVVQLEALVAEASQARRAADKVNLTLALTLIGTHGDRNFDSRTRTHTVRSLLSVLDVAGVEQYIDFLKTVFASNEPDVVVETYERTVRGLDHHVETCFRNAHFAISLIGLYLQ